MAVAIAVVVSWLLLQPHAMADERAEIAAVQAVAAIGFGVGGLGTLMLFVRRQWLQEQAHKLDRERVNLDRQIAEDNRVQAERQHERELAKAADDRHDATERRITELYMSAAEQLGHENATVRLTALHALDRLGQNHANHRQVIADIWCSYLRQPFIPPTRFTTKPEAATDMGVTDAASYSSIDPASMEYEVRVTAQRLLCNHLKDRRVHHDRTDEPPPVEPNGFWGLTRIDLTGAALINTDFTDCWFPEVAFAASRFHGSTKFERVRFARTARFNKALFNGHAQFHMSQFNGLAAFQRSRFDGIAGFDGVRFVSGAMFIGAEFNERVDFDEAWFNEITRFDGARFVKGAKFREAQFYSVAAFIEVGFNERADFHKVRFNGVTGFKGAKFDRVAAFHDAQFNGVVGFEDTQFIDRAEFDNARFAGVAKFHDTQVERIAEFRNASACMTRHHTWPIGWVLGPRLEDNPTWACLVKEAKSSVLEPKPQPINKVQES